MMQQDIFLVVLTIFIAAFAKKWRCMILSYTAIKT